MPASATPMPSQGGHAHGTADLGPLTPIAAPTSEEALKLLEQRRSLPLRALVAPGPVPAELERMLAIAARVPDHGRIVPWRFIVLEGAERAQAGDRLDALYGLQNPDRPAEKAHMWRDYLLRAPVTVVVVSRPDPQSKIPVFNQILSVGACCMNLIAAATALGYGAHWLLKWPGRDPDAAALLGVEIGREQVAGFIHLGRPGAQMEDRPRPGLDQVVTRWRP